jgi:hypothetical protein
MYWQPRWLVTFPDTGQELDVVDATGVVSRYRDHGLVDWLQANDQPAGDAIPQDNAIDAASAVLLASGQSDELASPNATLTQILGDQLRSGQTWIVKWDRQYQGIPYERQSAQVVLQAETGLVIGFGLTYPAPPPTSVSATVTDDQASGTALGQLASSGILAPTLVDERQEIVQPNNFWPTGDESPAPGTSRLAWVCTYSVTVPADDTTIFASYDVGYTVKVDSETGSVIGGSTYSTMARGNARRPGVPRPQSQRTSCNRPSQQEERPEHPAMRHGSATATARRAGSRKVNTVNRRHKR